MRVARDATRPRADLVPTSMIRDWWRPSAGPFLSAFAVVVTIALADGGYFRETWVWATLSLTCLASLSLVLRDTIVLGRPEQIGLAALAGFVGWVALSAAWSPTPQQTLEDAERGLVYVAAFLGIALALDRRTLRAFYSGIAGAIVVVSAYALVERDVGSPRRDPTQGTLLIEPFGYANAAGIFAALGILVSLELVLSARSRAERTAWIVGITVLVAALVQTESRGAWLALALGLLVLTVLRWRSVFRVAVPRRAWILTVVASLVAIAIVAADRPLGQRIDYWKVALSQWQENPWLGSGAGTFALYWLREGSPSAVLDAHNLYLETLAELGPVGLLLLMTALSVPIVAALGARTDPLLALGLPAYAAFLVHAGLDWDWEMPAVTLVGLLSGIGVLAACRRESGETALGARARGGWAAVALVIAGLAVAAAMAWSD